MRLRRLNNTPAGQGAQAGIFFWPPLNGRPRADKKSAETGKRFGRSFSLWSGTASPYYNVLI